MAFPLMAFSLASGLASNYLGNRGARREIERRQNAVWDHERTTNQLGEQRSRQQLRQGDVRRQGLGQIAGTYMAPDAAGAHADADAMNERVAARLGAQDQPGGGGQFSDQVRQFLATARRPNEDAAKTWGAGQVMRGLGRQTQDATTQATLQNAAITPEMIREMFWNAYSQQEADNKLQEALGGYSDGAALDELAAGILGGLGGLGTQAAAYTGHGR